MSETIEQEKLKNVFKALRAIYFAFLLSAFIYLLVLFRITSSHSGTGENIDTIRNIFIALSILAGIVKFWIQPNWLNKAKYYEKYGTLDEIVKKYTQRFSVTMALCTLPALFFGNVLAMMTSNLNEYWLFLGFSLILYATSIPRSAKLKVIVQNHAARSLIDSTTFVGGIKKESDFVEEAVRAAGEVAAPSLYRRICAFLIDVLLVFGVCLLMLKMPTIERYEGRRLFLYANSLTYLFLVVYQLFVVRFFGKTIGCSICRLRIISVAGVRLDLMRSLIRGFVQLWMVFGFFPLLLLLECGILFFQVRKGKNPYKRATWDKASATVVVQAT